MEETMKDTKQLLPEILKAAQNSGAELAPKKLLDLVSSSENPLASLGNRDVGNSYFQAIQEEFGTMRWFGPPETEPSPEVLEKRILLMRWLNRELIEWRSQDDTKQQKLTALFVTSRYFDIDNILWEIMPDGIESNKELLHALEIVVASSRVAFTSRDEERTPIWEKEAVASLEFAEANNDWVAIAQLWRAFESALIPNSFLTETIRCLNRFGVEYLVRGVSGVSQIASAMRILGDLSILQRLRLAYASSNPMMQFSCMISNFFRWPKVRDLNEKEHECLTALLGAVANEDARWKQWMQIFVLYPLPVQQSLGQVLVTAKSEAVQAYIEALGPDKNHGNARTTVAECLQYFKAKATDERRKALWKLAYEKWLSSDFTTGSQQEHLMQVSFSLLDYPVVGYILECLTEAEREARIQALCSSLQVLDNQWHESFSDFISAWNRLLSRIQPYAHTRLVISDSQNWLANAQYSPCDPNSDRYTALLARMR
jgi:hypothetical protein